MYEAIDDVDEAHSHDDAAMAYRERLYGRGLTTMDLYVNRDPRFAKWLVSCRLLREPFVVVDVGVQGGENRRWHVLDEYLVVHGFDAIEEVVRGLQQRNASSSNRHYHWIAAGSQDGDGDFFFRTDDACSSSFYRPGDERHRVDGQPAWFSRRVPVRRLDTLLAQGIIAPADFLKIDVEGYEKHVLAGAQQLLASTLGMEIETNFSTSPEYPKSHFGTIMEMLLPHRLLVFDLNFNRIPRAGFQHALRRSGARIVDDQASVGAISTLNVLYCRDFTQEANHPEYFATPRPSIMPQQMIKLMIIYELHGLNDVAVEIAERFRKELQEDLDVDRAITLLADRRCRRTPLRIRLRAAAGRMRRRFGVPLPAFLANR